MIYLKLKKIIYVLLICLFSTSVTAEVVKKVEVSGNKRISKETVMVFGDIKTGVSYTPLEINDLIKKLYDTNFFSKIDVNLENGILKIFLEENPIINMVVFKGVKADKIKKEILEIVTLKTKTSFNKSQIQNYLNRIKNFYREIGYFFVEIDTEVQELQNNRVNLIYDVRPGKKAKISKIFFLETKKWKTQN